MDGLGLVYEGQGNKGAAAYNQPSLQYGQTPLDAVAQNIERQNLIKQQQEFQLAKQKEKEKAAAFKDLGDINLSKWDIANKQELGGDILMAKNAMAELANSGVMPNDYTNPKSQKYNEIQLGIKNKIIEADSQKAKLDEAQKLLQADFDNPNPVFDREASIAAMKAYADAPNISARRAIDPSTLLVRKPKQFDTYEPLKDFKINDFVGSFGNDTPEGGTSGSTLNKANLKKEMDAIANNPINDEHYAQGVQKGLWNSKGEYAKALYDKAVLGYTPDFKKVVKAIKEPTDRNFLMTAGIDELRKRFGLGETTAEIFSGSGANAPQKIKIANAINIGDIKATIPYASAIETSTGNPIEGEGAIDVKSGQMSTPLVFNTTDKIVAIPSTGTYRFKDTETGETKEYKGTQKQIESQLIRDGYAKYKPMLLANYKDAEGTTKSAWIPASSLPTTSESKTLQGADAARILLERIAEEENAKAMSSAPAPTAATAKKQIKKADIATKAQAAGYTVDEYTKLLKSKNIEIVD